jgi:transposase
VSIPAKQHETAHPKGSMGAMDHLSILFLKERLHYLPDLNMIEKIWAVMKRRVERIRPRNVEELKAVVQRT